MYKYSADGSFLIKNSVIIENFVSDDVVASIQNNGNSNIFVVPNLESDSQKSESNILNIDSTLITNNETTIFNIPQEEKIKINSKLIPQEESILEEEQVRTIGVDDSEINLEENNIITSEIDIDDIKNNNLESGNVNRLCFLDSKNEYNKVCLDYDNLKSLYETGKSIESIIEEKVNQKTQTKVFEYNMIPNSELSNENTLKLHDIGIDDCKLICNSYDWCNSIDHHRSRNKCYLSNSVKDSNSNFRENINFDHYEKKK